MIDGVTVAGAPATVVPGGLAATTAGDGPAVVLVHGVGVGPDAFAPLAGLAVSAGYQVVVVHRPGYGDAAGQAPLRLPDQVDLLADLLDGLAGPRRPRPGRASGPGVPGTAGGPGGARAGGAGGAGGVSGAPGVAGVVGVSGGATLALLLAVRMAASGLPPVPVVAHEPLLGPLAAALHHRVRRAVSALGPPGRPVRAVATTGFVRRLVGEATWARLPASERAFVEANPELVAAESRAFAALAPTGAELALVRPHSPVLTTVGALSGADRRSAATVLASLARARVDRVPGAGHLAHVDAPDAFASVALAALATGAPSPIRSRVWLPDGRGRLGNGREAV